MKIHRNLLLSALIGLSLTPGFGQVDSVELIDESAASSFNGMLLDISKTLNTTSINEDLIFGAVQSSTSDPALLFGRFNRDQWKAFNGYVGCALLLLDVAADLSANDNTKLIIDLGAAAATSNAAISAFAAIGYTIESTLLFNGVVGVIVATLKRTIDSEREVARTSRSLNQSNLLELLYQDPVLVPRNPDSTIRVSRLTKIDIDNPDLMEHLYERLWDEPGFRSRLKTYQIQIGNVTNSGFLATTKLVGTGEILKFRNGLEVPETVKVELTRDEFLENLRNDPTARKILIDLINALNGEVEMLWQQRKFILMAQELERKYGREKLRDWANFLTYLEANADRLRMNNQLILHRYSSLLDDLEIEAAPEEVQSIRQWINTLSSAYSQANAAPIAAAFAAEMPSISEQKQSLAEGSAQIAGEDPRLIGLHLSVRSIASATGSDPSRKANQVLDALAKIQMHSVGATAEYPIQMIDADKVRALMDRLEEWLLINGIDPNVPPDKSSSGEFYQVDLEWRKDLAFEKPVLGTGSREGLLRLIIVRDEGGLRFSNNGALERKPTWKIAALEGPTFWAPVPPPQPDFWIVRVVDSEGRPVSGATVGLQSAPDPLQREQIGDTDAEGIARFKPGMGSRIRAGVRHENYAATLTDWLAITGSDGASPVLLVSLGEREEDETIDIGEEDNTYLQPVVGNSPSLDDSSTSTNTENKIQSANSQTIVGRWKWFTGSATHFKADGTVNNPNNTWSRSGRQVIIRWGDKWIDTLTLSEDGNRLEGKNQIGNQVWGTRIQ